MLNINNDINLRDVIGILSRGKWIITGICIISALIAGIASFFIIPEKYEASATVMINSSSSEKAGSAENDRLESLLGSLAEYPRMNIETCREQITNPRLLQTVIDQLELNGKKYTVDTLQTRVRSKIIENTRLIKITVTDDKPSRAAAIVNALAENLVEFINNNNRQRLNNSVQFLEEQIKEQEKELAGAVEQYREFLSRPEGVEELQNELNTKLQLLTQLQQQLVENEVQTATTRSALSRVKAILAETPQNLETRKALPIFAFLDGKYNEGKNGAGDNTTVKTSPSTVPSEEINPVYISLAQKKAELQEKLARLHTGQAQINDKISSIKPELERLQSKLAEKKVDRERLSNKVETLQSNYNMLTRKYQETKMSASAQVGEANIMITSKAQEPRQPVAPRKMLNIALAGITGLIAGIFLVFIQELLKKGYSESNGN